MRRILILEFLSLDGVMQAPGGPQEDTSDGFRFGGWQAPFNDDLIGKVMTEQMSKPFDLLLGRKTYDIFAGYWPKQHNEIAHLFNKATKYVVSHESHEYEWDKTIVISKNVVEELKKLKKEDGPDLQVYGSGNLVQTLLQHDLVDELWLKIYPLTLGNGKKLFAEGTVPQTWKLIKAEIGSAGVIYASYKKAGPVQTGIVGE